VGRGKGAEPGEVAVTDTGVTDAVAGGVGEGVGASSRALATSSGTLRYRR
jgi:hypothetical protein